jgi:hypothetical protein
MNNLRRLSRWIGLGLLAAAVVKELRRPARERTWHGRVLGFVPYDFRPPTFDRVRRELWNPRDPALLTPHAFGVGWGVNFGAVAKKLDLVA